MKFEACPVEPPGFGSGPLSSRIRSRHPSSARWKARLFPTMPAPMTTARAEAGREPDVSSCSDMVAREPSALVIAATRGYGLPLSTSSQNGPGEGRGTPLIRAAGVWKVFGPHAEKIVGSPDADLSRRELRGKTGCVA